MQILDRIKEDLYAPKDGLLDVMTISDPLLVCSYLEWASFKTHYITTSYVDKHFENHPAISTEYVKFLATNSGFEKVEKLSGLVDALTEKLTKMTDDAKNSASKADNASMKFTDALREVASLTKRVKLLEDKKRLEPSLSPTEDPYSSAQLRLESEASDVNLGEMNSDLPFDLEPSSIPSPSPNEITSTAPLPPSTSSNSSTSIKLQSPKLGIRGFKAIDAPRGC